MLKFLYRIICGFFLGISTLAPGISGSIVAIIVGIYHDLLEIFSNPFKDIKKSILIMVPVGIGVGISIVFFVLIFRTLFEIHEKAAYLLFAALIAGNLPIIISEIRKYEFKIYYCIFAVGAFAITYVLGWLAFAGGQTLSAGAVTAGIPLVALSGLAAGAALLVPGMSFSMILILTGIYGQLMYAAEMVLRLSTDYLLWIGVFVITVIVGLALVSKLIKAAFTKFPGPANAAVLGFMLGSFTILVVEGVRINDPNFAVWHGIAAVILGLGISAAFIVLLRFINKDKAQETSKGKQRTKKKTKGKRKK